LLLSLSRLFWRLISLPATHSSILLFALGAGIRTTCSRLLQQWRVIIIVILITDAVAKQPAAAVGSHARDQGGSRRLPAVTAGCCGHRWLVGRQGGW
jgi:hypothetical protein